jgi:glycosyltransferase involved in cell wall biosynthesis
MKMQQPLVSCIIPVWNGEKYLAEAIESVLGQTYPALEIVAVDDGSTDGTPALLSSYGERIVTVRQDQSGPAVARNAGIERSTGEFIAFLDADDLWDPRKTELQMARFAQRPDLAICLCEVRNFWSPEIETPQGGATAERMDAVAGWFAQSMLVKRDAFRAVGAFDTSLRHREAMDWLRRATDSGLTVDVVREILVHRRLHLTNRSRSRAANDHESLLRIARAALSRRARKGA